MNTNMILTESLTHDGSTLIAETLPLEMEHPASPGDSPPFPKSAEEGAILLKMACCAEKMTILGVARVFFVTKSNLAYGEWERMWKLKLKPERPPRSKRTSDKYALVGQEFGDPDGNGYSHLINRLPPCINALYFLAQLGRQLVLELILDGTIDESMTAAKARELRDQYKPELKKERAFNASRWLAGLLQHLQELNLKGTLQDREAVLPEAKEAVERALAETRQMRSAKSELGTLTAQPSTPPPLN